MPQFKRTQFVQVHPAAAYAVAADVAAYTDFLPLLQRASIRGARQKLGNGETFLAELVVGYEKLGIQESFVSKVTVDPDARTVSSVSTDGPMKSLLAHWEVVETPGGCSVTITIDYAFKNPLMQLAFGGLMEIAAGKIMNAFEDRAVAMARTVTLA